MKLLSIDDGTEPSEGEIWALLCSWYCASASLLDIVEDEFFRAGGLRLKDFSAEFAIFEIFLWTLPSE